MYTHMHATHALLQAHSHSHISQKQELCWGPYLLLFFIRMDDIPVLVIFFSNWFSQWMNRSRYGGKKPFQVQKAVFLYFLGLGTSGQMRAFSATNEADGHPQQKVFTHGVPIPWFHTQASRQKPYRRNYIPTSMLNEEEKARRRERVRLQVRQSRLRKKQRMAAEQLDAGQEGFYDLPGLRWSRPSEALVNASCSSQYWWTNTENAMNYWMYLINILYNLNLMSFV